MIGKRHCTKSHVWRVGSPAFRLQHHDHASAPPIGVRAVREAREVVAAGDGDMADSAPCGPCRKHLLLLPLLLDVLPRLFAVRKKAGGIETRPAVTISKEGRRLGAHCTFIHTYFQVYCVYDVSLCCSSINPQISAFLVCESRVSKKNTENGKHDHTHH